MIIDEVAPAPPPGIGAECLDRFRGGWKELDGPLPIIEGTVIALLVQRLPGDRDPKPVWLWVSKLAPSGGAEVDHWWSMYLRRFNLEHIFRFLKQTLGWTRPHLPDPAAADRWTWLILAAHTQLRLARVLVADHRLPWQQPLPAASMTPARTRTASRSQKPPQGTRPTRRQGRCGPGVASSQSIPRMLLRSPCGA